MHKPNFFIIGAPKCGTTALSEYLREHPNVFFSNPKEPDFFSTDIANRHKIHDINDYLALFSHSAAHHHAIGEGSVGYLLSKVALGNILNFNCNARFIVMLRNPVDLAHSWHSEARYNCGEIEQDFEEAWRLQDYRYQGQYIPHTCPDVKLLLYREVGAIGSQLERVLALVPRERVHVILFEDFRANTREVYEDALQFLGLPRDGRTDFPVINDSKHVRSPYIMELSHLVAKAKQRLGIRWGTGLLEALNVKRRPRPQLMPAFRDELTAYFCPEVAKIERLTGHDLSSWRTLSDGRVLQT